MHHSPAGNSRDTCHHVMCLLLVRVVGGQFNKTHADVVALMATVLLGNRSISFLTRRHNEGSLIFSG